MKKKILADFQISISVPLIFEALTFCIKHFGNIALHSFLKKEQFYKNKCLDFGNKNKTNLRTKPGLLSFMLRTII